MSAVFRIRCVRSHFPGCAFSTTAKSGAGDGYRRWGPIARYRVDRPQRRTRATCVGVSPRLSIALASRICADGAFPENVTLELRDGTEDGVEHPTCCCRGVEVVVERAQRHLTVAQCLCDLEKLLERPTQAVEPPDDKGVDSGELTDRAASFGRDRETPEAASSWMTSQPAARSASSCSAVVCSSVETRA